MSVKDLHTRELYRKEFLNDLKAAGLLCIPEEGAVFAMEGLVKKQELLKKSYVTPYEVAKYHLLNKRVSLKTVKNMVNDGRIRAQEWYRDEKDRIQILTLAIKRLSV